MPNNIARREEMEPVPAADEIIAVLGMHRSGTSSLAGLLEEAGLHFGNVFVRNRSNPKGNREDPDIRELHDDILRANGGSWDAPPDRLTWTPAHYRRLGEIVAGYARHERWAFKDPRTLLTLDGWMEAGLPMRLVGTFRDPSLVAASLLARSKRDPALSFALYCRYNERLLTYHGREPFPLVEFSMEPDEYLQSVQRLLAELGLRADVDSFFEERLRNQRSGDPAPAQAIEIYEALRERAVSRR